jgi:hypothetical protein
MATIVAAMVVSAALAVVAALGMVVGMATETAMIIAVETVATDMML